MFKRFSTNYMVALFLIDVAIIQISLQLAIRLRLIIPFGQTVGPGWILDWMYTPSFGLAFIGLLWASSFLISSCYTPRRIIFWFDEFQHILLAHTIAALSLAGIFYLGNVELLRLVFAYFYIVSFILLIGYRAGLRLWHRLRRGNSGSIARILIVGAGSVGESIVREFEERQWPGVEFIGFVDDDIDKRTTTIHGLPVLGSTDETASIIDQHKVDEVIIALPRDAHANVANLVAKLYTLPVRLRIVPDYFDLAYYGATVETLGGIPLIGLRDPAIDGIQRFAKRLIDIIVSVFVLLLFSPLLMLVAILIKLEDGGSIFYWAPRVGENGKVFYMLKFRSMIVGAERLQQSVNQTDDANTIFHKAPDDPRVTKIGRLIRRTSIDEIPQLVNVLLGEMSLVGPRPELPWLVKEYEPWQRKRFAVPQGITGWWQVNGRSDNMMHLHTDQDLYYIQHYSLWLDLQILWKTVAVVLRGKGAY